MKSGPWALPNTWVECSRPLSNWYADAYKHSKKRINAESTIPNTPTALNNRGFYSLYQFQCIVAVSRQRRSQRRISLCPPLQSMLWLSSLLPFSVTSRMRSRSLVFGRNSSSLCCPSGEWVYLANWQDAEIDWSIWISRVDGWPPPPCPGGSPAEEGLAIVTFSPGVCEKEWRTLFCSVIGWCPKNESRLP